MEKNIRVIIESPFKGVDYTTTEENVRYAKLCMKDCLYRGEAPIASHLLYTQCLDDTIEQEREMGINAGLCWGQLAEKTVVYTDRGISKGMQYGINTAIQLGRVIEYRTLNGYKEQHHKINIHSQKMFGCK